MAGPGATGGTARDRAFARLHDLDPIAAAQARTALDWVVGAAGLEALDQLSLQQLCWYDLPFTWVVPDDVRRSTLRSLAHLLDLAGLPRYAAICRDATTERIWAQWATDPREGFRAWRRAAEASGVEPPPPTDLGWGSLQGPAEHEALRSAAGALELAVATGLLRPGARGWRAAQQRLVDEHLDVPRPERFGESLRQAIVTERLLQWVEGPPWLPAPSRARAQLLGAVADGLLHDEPVPRGAGRALSGVRWVLDGVATAGTPRTPGLRLTASGRLPRAVEAEARAQLPTGGEPDAVVALAVGAGLLRRRRGRLVLTPAGAAARDDGRARWRAVTTGLVLGDDRRAVAGEVALAVLLAEAPVPLADLEHLVAVPLAELGSAGGRVGAPLPGPVVAGLLDEHLRAWVALGMVPDRSWRAGRPALTATGAALARAALRARGIRPLHAASS